MKQSRTLLARSLAHRSILFRWFSLSMFVVLASGWSDTYAAPTKTQVITPAKKKPATTLTVPSPQALGEQARTLSMLEALKTSRRQNLNLARARALMKAAHAAYQAQVQRWWPTLHIGVGGKVFGGLAQGNFGDTQTLPVSATQVNPMLQIAYTLNPARNAFRSKSAFQQFQARRYQRIQVQDAVLLATALAYQEVMYTQVSLSLVDQSIRDLQALLSLSRKRLESGVGNKAEVLQLQGRLIQEQQIRPGTVLQLRRTATRLTLALGRSTPPLLYANPQKLHRIVLPASKMSLSQREARVIRQHPALQRYVAQQRALSHQKHALLWGTWLPAVGLSFEGGLLTAGFIRDPLALATGPYYGLSLQLRWTFQVSTIGQSQEIDHKRQAVSLRLRELHLELRGRLHLARARTQLAQQQLNSAKKFLQVARHSLQLNQARFESGTGRVLEVIEAQRILVQARQRLLASLIAVNRAQLLEQGLLGRLTPRSLLP